MAVSDIDYAARTFETLYQAGLEFLRRRVGDTRYNSFVNTDVAPNMVAVMAYFQAQSAFYYDRRQTNSFLSLADTREAAVLRARDIGYTARPATSASVAMTATPAVVQAVPITIPAGTVIRSGDLSFELLADAVIPPNVSSWPDGTTDDLIVFEEGLTHTESYTSNGTANQSFTLSRAGLAEGSLRVTILGQEWVSVSSLTFSEDAQFKRDAFLGTGLDNQAVTLAELNAITMVGDPDGLLLIVQPAGATADQAQEWTQVSAFTGAPREFIAEQLLDGSTIIRFGLDSDGSAPPAGSTGLVLYNVAGAQRRYQLVLDADDRATVQFGNGSNGAIPQSGALIEVAYRTGGGLRGNVAAGAVSQTVQGNLPNGTTVAVTLRNLEAGRGGRPPESIESIKFNATRLVTANSRAVTRSDFAARAASYFSLGVGAPAYATAYLKQQVPELNTVVVPVWGFDADGNVSDPNTPLKLGIQQELNSRRTVTTLVETVDGNVLVIDFDIAIELTPGSSRSSVFAAVTQAIENYFRSALVQPGSDVSISQLYDIIQGVDGVKSSEIERARGGRPVSLDIGIGDGTTTTFSGDIAVPEGTSLIPRTVRVSDIAGGKAASDTGLGGFAGDLQAGISPGSFGNSVDYNTGIASLTFATPPQSGSIIRLDAVVQTFNALTDSLGSSDGSVVRVDSSTRYYPIVKRAPKGIWSGDQVKIVDGFRVGTTNQMVGILSQGVLPNTLSIVDANGQTVTDNGAGVILQSAVPVGTVNYNTGEFQFTYNNAPVAVIRASYRTNTVDLVLPENLFPAPLTAGRMFFWGGFGADGAQGFGELIAADDSIGNVVGNVDINNTAIIRYEDGLVRFTWNTTPAPGFGVQSIPATLSQAPDGVTKVFQFTTGLDLSRNGIGGEGRLRFQLTDLAQPGVAINDAYDNFNGDISGDSIDTEGTSFVDYASGSGQIAFEVPPAVGAPLTFNIVRTNVVVAMNAAFAYRVKTPNGAGLDQSLFADHNGRFWSLPAQGTSNPFPTDRLDHTSGRFQADLAGVPVAAGLDQVVSYDALNGIPPRLNIPVDNDEIATVGRVFLTEKVISQ